MPRGGARVGAGRPTGARNRRTEELTREIEESGLTPLAYLLSIFRDEDKDEKIRLEAAKAAAPFAHAKLSAVDMDLRADKRTIDDYEPHELIELIQSGKEAH